MRHQEKWEKIVAPVFVGTPFELVGIECVGGGKHTTVRIFIDKPGGISIDEIVDLTRQINIVLEVEEPIKGLYTLEVSSPGLERPLFKSEHFKQQIGQIIALRTRQAIKERQNFKGLLKSADDESIELEIDGQLFSFSYADIDKARVIPDIKI